MSQTRAQKSEIGGHQFSIQNLIQTGPPEAIFWPEASRSSFGGPSCIMNTQTAWDIPTFHVSDTQTAWDIPQVNKLDARIAWDIPQFHVFGVQTA